LKTIPREWFGPSLVGDRAPQIARAIYDCLGHEAAARVAGELVQEIESRSASARRGRALLDAWAREED
jgi:hypothetical protein